MQLSQTLSSAIAQIKVSNSPITNRTKKDLAPEPSFFFVLLAGSVLFRASAFTDAELARGVQAVIGRFGS